MITICFRLGQKIAASVFCIFSNLLTNSAAPILRKCIKVSIFLTTLFYFCSWSLMNWIFSAGVQRKNSRTDESPPSGGQPELPQRGVSSLNQWSAGYFSINCLFKNASSYVLFRLTNQPKPKCIAVIIFSKVWHDKNINFAFLPLCFIITQQSQVQPQKNSSNQQNHIFLLQLVVQTTLDVYYTLNLQFSIVALC